MGITVHTSQGYWGGFSNNMNKLNQAEKAWHSKYYIRVCQINTFDNLELGVYHAITAIQFFLFVLWLPALVSYYYWLLYSSISCFVSLILFSSSLLFITSASVSHIHNRKVSHPAHHWWTLVLLPAAFLLFKVQQIPGPASRYGSLPGRENMQWQEYCMMNPLASKYFMGGSLESLESQSNAHLRSHRGP